MKNGLAIEYKMTVIKNTGIKNTGIKVNGFLKKVYYSDEFQCKVIMEL
jgi:5-methylthioribose kinase